MAQRILAGEWTPAQDWHESSYSPSAYQVMAKLLVRDLVRETAYNVARLEAETSERGEAYSRAYCLYEQACNAYRTVAVPSEADEFIAATYQIAARKVA